MVCSAEPVSEEIKPIVPPRVKRSDSLAEAICSRLILGESLTSICKRGDFPSYPFITDWLRDDNNFAQQYARAREEQAEYLAQQTLTIADEATPETVQVAKLQVDARKWYAAKVKPRVYGDRVGDIHVNSTVNNFLVITEEKRAEIMHKNREALMR